MKPCKRRTACRLSHINALASIYPTNNQSMKFLQKILRIGGSEKLSFFESAIWMITLVSIKFIAMRNITLYSVKEPLFEA